MRIIWSEIAQATFVRFMAGQAGMMAVNRAVEALADDPALRTRSSAAPTTGCALALAARNRPSPSRRRLPNWWPGALLPRSISLAYSHLLYAVAPDLSEGFEARFRAAAVRYASLGAGSGALEIHG